MNSANNDPSAKDFDYELPTASIAQAPALRRDGARLLVDAEAGPEHRSMSELASLIRPGDLVVLNDTKVIPARIRFRRPTGGAGEILLLEPQLDGRWQALVRPSKKLPEGQLVEIAPGFEIVVGERIAGGRRIVELRTSGSVEAALAANGELPLPPYITAPVPDFGRYQTVYATHPGSVAAPTAGLHLTEHTIAAMNDAGASIARVQLRVGLDTFRPLGEGPLDHHVMHTEIYAVPEQTWELIGQAERVVAVGTTVVRALESVVATGELSGRTNLFIRSPYEFGVVDALLTNFHMPRSTLLVMIDAFIGPRWRELYQIAIDEGYRMLSFGDGMFLTRRTLDPRSSASR